MKFKETWQKLSKIDWDTPATAEQMNRQAEMCNSQINIIAGIRTDRQLLFEIIERLSRIEQAVQK